MVSVFWDAHSIIYIDYFEKGNSSTATIHRVIGAFEGRNHKKKTIICEEEKNHLSLVQFTVPQVNENNGQIEWVGL